VSFVEVPYSLDSTSSVPGPLSILLRFEVRPLGVNLAGVPPSVKHFDQLTALISLVGGYLRFIARPPHKDGLGCGRATIG
jgi:hypothetical protein